MKARLMQVIRLALAMWARKPKAAATSGQEDPRQKLLDDLEALHALRMKQREVECDHCGAAFLPRPDAFVETSIMISRLVLERIGWPPSPENVAEVCRDMKMEERYVMTLLRDGVVHGVPRAYCRDCLGVRTRVQRGGGR